MPRKKNNAVAVIGEFFIDEIFSGFNAMPKLGEECFARRFQREVGGGAATTACGLAKLGVPVSVFGFVGRDDGNWVVQRLESYGVNCAGLEYHPSEPTGITVSASTREDRAFFSYYGANEPLDRMINRPTLAATLGTFKWVHFACAPDAETAGRLFASLSRKARLSIDVQSHVSWLTRPESLNILRHCAMFFPNEREGSWISAAMEPHDILLRLRDKGLRGVGLKLGGKGAALLWGRRQFLADPFPVESVDTTGAGDSFNAGFLFARLRGDNPQHCLEVANICGALSTRALGGIAAFPGQAELADCEDQLERSRRK
jgi:sugar/nucleoside kinase (ribokinase family)